MSSNEQRDINLWLLPLAAALLPASAAIVAAWLSMQLDLVPACNPLLDGCVSISRAARHELPNYLFRALVLPGAIVQWMTWVICRSWLRSLGTSRFRADLLPWLGAVGAIALVLYGAFLGTEGAAYRWLRRYGTIGYFSTTCLCFLITTGELVRLADSTAALQTLRVDRFLLGVCVVLLVLGIVSVTVAPQLEPDAKNRLENIAEWWMGVGLTACFLALAALWQRTRCAMRITVRES